jgi:putative transposase
MKDRTMKRSRFTEEQIIAVLRKQGAGVSTAEVCRKHGISSATFYAWKAKFGGMDVSEAKRLKQLEDENAKLKRLLPAGLIDEQCDVGAQRDLRGDFGQMEVHRLGSQRGMTSAAPLPSFGQIAPKI